MNTNAKICKQCGELKPLEQFRKYYGGRKGSYTICKMCEKINARAKYLRAKGDALTDSEQLELNKIETLWAVQKAAGFQPPRAEANRKVPLVNSLNAMISKYTALAERMPTGTKNCVAPAELVIWLSCELTEDPEYYLSEVYEQLRKKYRPQLRIGADMLPVYDETYKVTLEAILARFDAYEEDYYNDD